MQATKYAEQQNTRHELPKLDDRYGKIGISAVAAAVRCRGKARQAERAPAIQRDSD